MSSSLSLSSFRNFDRNLILFSVFDACRCGYFEFIKNVFNEYQIEINLLNELNQNCLMICCEFNQIEILKYLISKYDKKINYSLFDNENHWNCLHYALRYNNFRIAQILLNKPSNTPFQKYSNDANGYNPFDLLTPNLYKKQLYDDIYNQTNKQIQRKMYTSSFTYILVRPSFVHYPSSKKKEISLKFSCITHNHTAKRSLQEDVWRWI